MSHVILATNDPSAFVSVLVMGAAMVIAITLAWYALCWFLYRRASHTRNRIVLRFLERFAPKRIAQLAGATMLAPSMALMPVSAAPVLANGPAGIDAQASILSAVSTPESILAPEVLPSVRAPDEEASPISSLPATSAGTWIIVCPGDTLWSIATRFVPQNANIADFVHQIWVVNEGEIGSNPHLIYPGQVLLIPKAYHVSPTHR